MLLTLENIQNQQFNQRFRGYDMAEVDAFLDKIAESYLFLSTENSKIKEEIKAIKNERNQSVEEEQSFRNAIVSAQAFADDIKNKAENHAVRLKEDAKEKSTAILEEAQAEINTLQSQINSLAGEKERIKTDLKSFLHNYLTKVDDDDHHHINQDQTNPPENIATLDQTIEPITVEEPTEAALGMEIDIDQELSTSDSQESTDDVAILYEKIDLNEDFSPVESTDISEFSTDELDSIDLPDLEGDMLYSLEDPLDTDQGPAVIIDPLDEK